MKKKIWIYLSVLSLPLMVITILIVTKPNEADFVYWMEEKYNVHCYDPTCDELKVDIIEDGKVTEVTLTTAQGSYSPGIFVMKKEMVFRNLEDSTYTLELKINGLLGKIYLIEEKNTVPIKKR